ncbi:MAG: deoxyribose-phosphate aldolase [Wenzhouxiangellaceae bacterium]|nr:deoxyribose-phosphate aldolase [Wenzhouxiangellaceae bacterium]
MKPQSIPATDADCARRLLAILDLTRLEDDTDDQAVRALCRRALAAPVRPAAICVYRHFLAAATEELGSASSIKRATVANFPAGDPDPKLAALECEQAIDAGADEVDVVLPWRALAAGDEAVCADLVAACRSACGDTPLKVILESGMLANAHRIRRASEIAIDAGADFLKTSTGKVAVNATLEAARVMLEAIVASGRPVGIKISGGVRTLNDARPYLELTEQLLGRDAIAPARFRIGASGLLDDLLGHLKVE